jgi:hypothetical protein
MNIVSAIILSFLPKRYRYAFTTFEIPSSGSIIGGFLESAVAFGLLIHSYSTYMNERLAAIPLLLMEKAAEKGGESAVASMGGFVLIDFCFRITTILFAFFLLEGVVRVIAAIASRETVPSLPLKVLEYVHAQVSAEQKERSMGARLRDEVQVDPTGERLQVASCRPKQWNQLTTVSHDGQFYELITEQKASAPRPFVYLLRKKPPTAVIRGICAYDPNEALQTK